MNADRCAARGGDAFGGFAALGQRPAAGGRRAARLLLSLLLAVFGAVVAAGEAAPVVPPEVAAALKAAQDEPDAAKALSGLDAYQGPAHAYLHLLRGQLALRLGDDAQAAPERDRRRGDAERAFAAALELDARLRPARLGLARLAAARADWKRAGTHIGAALDWDEATADELRFAAHCAVQAQDYRVAAILVEQGLARFPADAGLRRLDLAVLVRSGRSEAARQALLALLTDQPGEAAFWRHLAWAAHESKDNAEALAALELALLAAPGDAAVRQQLAVAQLHHGMPQAALATARPLVTPGAGAAAIEIAARAAAEAGEVAQGRAWLAAVPAERRTRALRLLAARLAVQGDDLAGALAAIAELVVLGESDPGVLAWAGQVAERAQDDARAEAFYAQAAAADHPAAAQAILRLVALHVRAGRLDEARDHLATYLAKRPDDAQAKALQAQLAARKR